MSASSTCPLCNGSTFRRGEHGGYMICECVDIVDYITANDMLIDVRLAKGRALALGIQRFGRARRPTTARGWLFGKLRRIWRRLTVSRLEWQHERGAGKVEYTEEEHKARHVELHRALDELIADWMDHQPIDGGKRLTNTTIMELAQWSHEQTTNPTTPRK